MVKQLTRGGCLEWRSGYIDLISHDALSSQGGSVKMCDNGFITMPVHYLIACFSQVVCHDAIVMHHQQLDIMNSGLN